jgi:hypothetical protein
MQLSKSWHTSFTKVYLHKQIFVASCRATGSEKNPIVAARQEAAKIKLFV